MAGRSGVSAGRINFVRRFFGGTEYRYVGTALRVGHSTGVADARAIGDYGEVAIMAHPSAYRYGRLRRVTADFRLASAACPRLVNPAAD